MRKDSDWKTTIRICCVGVAWLLATTFSSSALIAQAQKAPPLKVQIIYLGRGGCQPSEVHRKGGNFRLYVVNLSPTRNLQLTFHPENAANISNKDVKNDDNEWLQTIDVHPGRYVLEATNSPEHHCSVVVE